MRVFAISGYSGTGKTSLVEQVIKALSEEGYTVVTAKTSIHDVKEVEGTDTWKHIKAGAKTAAILGPHSAVIRHAVGKSLQDIFAGIDADFLIIEGMKESKIPKIWCIGNTDVDKGKIPESTKAVVGWVRREKGVELEVPFLKTDDIGKIVSIVKQEAIELSQDKA
ncbi:MAG: molybdopterin-guanine dinucleotide biosynthesis protein B [Candidatus Thorarchaeota archaeon]|nr:molybdopterin-guanine dinucleotide biosynthesis protein B [Candidatus Thorarchaeota archaeon]